MTDPKKGAPITITREELHRRIWQTELHTLAKEFGITQHRLVEICDQLAIPYPRPRYWQRMNTGKAVVAFDLPKPSKTTPRSIVIEPSEKSVSPRSPSSGWHPLIATWRRQRAQVTPAHSRLPSTADWTPAELRALRFLNTIFREVEKHGFVPRDSRQWRRFSFRYQTVEIGCSLRERNRRLREKRDATGETIFTLKPSGQFVFKIESYLEDAKSIRREWADKPPKRLEEMVPDIISSLLRVGPALVRQSEEERERLRRHFEDQEIKELEVSDNNYRSISFFVGERSRRA